MTGSVLLLGALLLTQTPAASWSVDASASTIGFDVRHPLHEVHGESRNVEARAVLRPDGKALIMARVPVSTFRSGDSNRDAHMLEVLESSQYPFVVLKAVVPLAMPASFPATVSVEPEGTLEFHGRTRELRVPLTLEFRSAEEVRVRGEFAVSLDAYEIERPSLLLVKIDDACRIGVDLLMRRP